MHNSPVSHRTVAVFDNSDHLETRRLRICFADGKKESAIWRGLAYPLLTGDRINIAGEAKVPHSAVSVRESGQTPDVPVFSVVDGGWGDADGPNNGTITFELKAEPVIIELVR